MSTSIWWQSATAGERNLKKKNPHKQRQSTWDEDEQTQESPHGEHPRAGGRRGSAERCTARSLQDTASSMTLSRDSSHAADRLNIITATTAMSRLKGLWDSRNISFVTKCKLYKCLVVSMLRLRRGPCSTRKTRTNSYPAQVATLVGPHEPSAHHRQTTKLSWLDCDSTTLPKTFLQEYVERRQQDRTGWQTWETRPDAQWQRPNGWPKPALLAAASHRVPPTRSCWPACDGSDSCQSSRWWWSGTPLQEYCSHGCHEAEQNRYTLIVSTSSKS